MKNEYDYKELEKAFCVNTGTKKINKKNIKTVKIKKITKNISSK